MRDLEERAEEVVDVRHRGVVDHERPRPVLAHPEPAVALPQPPERGEHEQEEEHAPGRLSQPEGASLPRALGCDRRHATMLTTLGRGGLSSPAMPLEPARTVAELRELQELTGDENGAQRVAWTDTWVRAREWLGEKLAGLPLELEEDEAANQGGTPRGGAGRAGLIGGHIDPGADGGGGGGGANRRARAGGVRRARGGGGPGAAGRRREARGRDPRDCEADRRGRGVHDGRRRDEAGDRHVGRRDGGVPARPAPPGRRAARGDALERAGGVTPVRRGGGRRGRVGADLVDRADPLRRRADRARRRGCARGGRRVAPAAERPAARPGRGVARRRADGDALRPVAAGPLAHEARGHEAGAPGARGTRARRAGDEDDRPRRLAATLLGAPGERARAARGGTPGRGTRLAPTAAAPAREASCTSSRRSRRRTRTRPSSWSSAWQPPIRTIAATARRRGARRAGAPRRGDG